MKRWFVDRQPQQGIPSVSLRRLLPEARFVGCEDFEVSGCTADSRRLDPGQVFVAVRGERTDGHAFVTQAMERGAAGVVVERPVPEAGRLQVVVPDSRAALARLCQALAGDPSEQMLTMGVTGSCGRTVTALYLRAIFEAAGGRYGLVGRLGWSDGASERPAGAGVPGAEGLAGMLAGMVDRGCAGAVLEFDPEALRRGRVAGISLDAAVVSDVADRPGLSPDVVVARRAAMARLFRQVAPGGAAVVNADDPQAELLGAVNLDARRVAFGLNADADVTARVERLDRSGSRVRLHGFDREATVSLRLAGVSSVSHALAAAAVAWSLGVGVDAVVAGLESVTSVPGRLDWVDEGQGFDVRVDQARDAAELHEALACLRATQSGRVHCVFGAEGLREGARAERIALAAAAEALADRVTVTTDNPSSEDPDRILDDLLAGFRHPGRVRVEPDRRFAIEA
ncbi:MAG: Mur ligase domain-containing protein, partial [Planctomycetia bacterium]|nr:Mur ligase domain-containing protein [Planctomycetia bacterium]